MELLGGTLELLGGTLHVTQKALSYKERTKEDEDEEEVTLHYCSPPVTMETIPNRPRNTLISKTF